jgi:hypothetical protein
VLSAVSQARRARQTRYGEIMGQIQAGTVAQQGAVTQTQPKVRSMCVQLYAVADAVYVRIVNGAWHGGHCGHDRACFRA